MVSKLSVQGRYVVDEFGQSVRLVGVNKHGFEDSPNGHWMDKNGVVRFRYWDTTVVQDNLDAIRAWGGNVIRIHERVEYIVNNTDNHLTKLKELISLADARGIYVVIDGFTIISGSQTALPYPPYCEPNTIITNQDDFVNYWAFLANELKTFPNVIFELWNEPHGDATAKESWFNVAQRVITAIRAITDHIIIFQWDFDIWVNLDYPTSPHGDLSWTADSRVQGTNVLYSTHIYGDFTRGGVKVTSYADIKEAFQYTLLPWATNVPLLIGETAWKPELVYPSTLEQARNIFINLNELNIFAYAAWWWWPSGVFALLQAVPNFQPNEWGTLFKQAIIGIVPPLPRFDLMISISVGGTTNPPPNTYSYTQGQTVQVVASPAFDYRFVEWNLDGITRTENPIVITMNEAHSLTAAFELIPTGALIANANGPYIATVANPTVSFKGLATDGTPPYSWLWNFGDGITSTEQNPTHTYPATEAIYNITLTVTDSVNATASSITTATISPLPPPRPCFIATVAFGSPLAPQLDVFRSFCDRCLPNLIVHVYYKVGKHLARWIEGKRAIKRYTRETLNLLAELLEIWEA